MCSRFIQLRKLQMTELIVLLEEYMELFVSVLAYQKARDEDRKDTVKRNFKWAEPN